MNSAVNHIDKLELYLIWQLWNRKKLFFSMHLIDWLLWFAQVWNLDSMSNVAQGVSTREEKYHKYKKPILKISYGNNKLARVVFPPGIVAI